MKKQTVLRLTAFALACFLLVVAVWRYEAAGVAAVAASFALIAEIIGSI